MSTERARGRAERGTRCVPSHLVAASVGTDTLAAELGFQPEQTDQPTAEHATNLYVAHLLRHRRSERIPGHEQNLRRSRRAGGSNKTVLVGLAGFEPATP